MEAIQSKLGIKVVYDLSATPFFLRGSGYDEGVLFSWVVSDFSLIDAIEAGIVKVPRVPVEDDRMIGEQPTYRDLWDNIRDQLPKKGRKTEQLPGIPQLPGMLEGALRTLYRNYEKEYRRWEQNDAARAKGRTPPVYVAEQWGRRWITLDTSRVALALARTRLMAARFPYYLLADSPEGRKRDADQANGRREPAGSEGKTDTNRKDDKHQGDQKQGADAPRSPGSDIKRGFVYKRVPHVTLKSIANNPDIKDGMTCEQIDAAIAKHAETELLFDKPYEDSSKVRVTGPFTVESLSPHRRLTVETKKARAAGKDGLSLRTYGPDQFGTMILDIDTNYDGESFFVRHAYFTGAQEPYDKLKRALRADIDEAAWSALYSTVSQSFARPATGKIAVKVINHYGDEVLKVYSV